MITDTLNMREMAALAGAFGCPGFDQALWEFARSRFGASYVNCYLYSEAGGMECLLGAGDVAPRCAAALNRAWVDRYFRLDPNLPFIVSAHERPSRMFLPFDPGRIVSNQYRELFWRRSLFLDKCSMVFFDGSAAFYCNFYRCAGGAKFTREDTAALQAAADLIEALLKAHRRAVMSWETSHAGFAAARNADALSARERTVMQHILVGQNSRAIALDQGLSLNTVKTYRKRLYRKLGVSTLNELHARYRLSWRMPASDGRP